MQAHKLLIGWASVDVTPDSPATLAGQFHTRVSTHVKDPVTATALALDSSSEQALIVSLDSVWISDDVRDACREKLRALIPDFDPLKLMISVTHTHTAPEQHAEYFGGPDFDEPKTMKPAAYSAFLAGRLAEACATAWKTRGPGAVAWGRSQAVVGFNRRAAYFDGHSTMYGKTDDPQFSHNEGDVDHGVDQLFTYDTDNHLTGMVVNLACPSQVTEGANFISADFWHETRLELKKRHGQGVFVLGQCSAAGDQSPHLLLNKRAEERMFRLKGLDSDFNLAQRQEIANRVAAAVDEALPLASTDIRAELPFAHVVSTLSLPAWKITAEESKFCAEQAANYHEALKTCDQNPVSGPYSHNFRRVGYYGRVVERFERQRPGDTLPMESHVIRLGDIAFASNRFELYLDFGVRIKARSKAVQTFVVQLAGQGTYLPTRRAVEAKSYGAGAADSLVGPEGGQTIVEEQLKIIDALFAE